MKITSKLIDSRQSAKIVHCEGRRIRTSVTRYPNRSIAIIVDDERETGKAPRTFRVEFDVSDIKMLKEQVIEHLADLRTETVGG